MLTDTRPILMLRDRRKLAHSQLARLNRIETRATHSFRYCDLENDSYLIVIRRDIDALVEKINALNEAIEREYTELTHRPLTPLD